MTMKAGWNVCHRKQDMWVQVVRHKYTCGQDLMPRFQIKKSQSNFWSGLCKGWENAKENLLWRVGKGSLVNFWTDPWLPNCGRLQDNALGYITLVDSVTQVKTFVLNTGDWGLNKLLTLLPSNFIDKIKAYPPLQSNNEDDIIVWNNTPDGTLQLQLMLFLFKAISLNQICCSSEFRNGRGLRG